jgi:hypothetical protein
MGLIKALRIKYDQSIIKFNVQGKIDKILESKNIRIIAWIFIISRVYRIYQLVIYYNNISIAKN